MPPPEISENLIARSYSSLRLAFLRAFRAPRPGLSEPLFPRDRVFWWFVAAYVFCLIVIMLYFDGDLLEWKRREYPEASAPEEFLRRFTHFGKSEWILVSTAIMGLSVSITPWKKLPRAKLMRRIDFYANLNFVFFTVAIAGTSGYLLKNIIGRARPKLFDEVGPVHFEFGALESVYASFPSGHSTTFGSICMALALLWPRAWPVWLLFALLGGASRFVLDAHYLTDVMAGLAYGAGFVLIAARWLAVRGCMFSLNEGWRPVRGLT